MGMKSVLKEYRQKREFKRTSEPGLASGKKNKGQYLVFVVHKHAARRLHYDLRLEMQGVLKSFAVPKGPTLDPSVKRLAVHVEDHPFAYKDFEGIIPEHNYGAGNVIIWDRGFYGPPFAAGKKEAEESLAAGIRKGDLKFVLAGTKLKGEFALVKTGWDEKSWLLLKKKDRYTSSDDVLALDRSVLSGKTVEELSGEVAGKPATHQSGHTVSETMAADAPKRPMPHKIKPMLAAAVQKPFNHKDWLFEVKWDGYRAIAELDGNSVALYSRNQISLANKFPPVVESLQKLGLHAVLDGEIVVADNSGKPDFQKLQDFPKSKGGHLVYYVFDILFHDGRDLMGLPLIKRKELLKTILPISERIKFSEHIRKDGVSLFEAARQKGIEGIVAKHSLSLYKPGARSGQWVKIKNHVTQDCVIAGFTEPRGARKYLGSLVLGAYDNGTLVYIGHSGGGFDTRMLKTMYDRLQPLSQEACPFETVPPKDSPTTWIKPLVVCEVAFAGWTKETLMRQPRFVRLREDKNPKEAEL
jgi:bifunctional non-homologous end joining protein LigD